MEGICVLFVTALLWVWIKGSVVSQKRGGYTLKHYLRFKIKATLTLTLIFIMGICVNNPFVYYMIWAVLVQFVDAIMATVMEAVKEDI